MRQPNLSLSRDNSSIFNYTYTDSDSGRQWHISPWDRQNNPHTISIKIDVSSSINYPRQRHHQSTDDCIVV